MKKIYKFKFIASVIIAFSFTTNVTAQCVTPPTPGLTNPTICSGTAAVLSATGASSLITGWYTNSFGGNAVGTGSTYITPILTVSTVYYVAQLAPTTTESLVMPAQTSPFTGNVRGYWFTAPTSFMITGTRVPLDASTGNSNIAILKLAANPPVYSTTTNAFDLLYLTQNNTSGTGTISVNIPVYAGDIIGVLGNRNDINSYAAVSPYTSALGTYSLTLGRLGMQFPLSSSPPQAVWTETTTNSSISRVELYTTLGCLNSLTADSVTVITCSTGLNELTENSLQIYPNPSNGNLHVDIDHTGSALTMEITDALGKVVFISEIVGYSNHYDISYLSEGVYTYKLSTKHGQVKIGKLVKQ